MFPLSPRTVFVSVPCRFSLRLSQSLCLSHVTSPFASHSLCVCPTSPLPFLVLAPFAYHSLCPMSPLPSPLTVSVSVPCRFSLRLSQSLCLSHVASPFASHSLCVCPLSLLPSPLTVSVCPLFYLPSPLTVSVPCHLSLRLSQSLCLSHVTSPFASSRGCPSDLHFRSSVVLV